MTIPQRVFGAGVVLIVAFSALYYYLLAAAGEGLAPGTGPMGRAENAVFDLAHGAPYVVAPLLVIQPFLLLLWILRNPRVANATEYRLAATRLRDWLSWSAVLIALIAVGVVVSLLRRSILAVFFMGLLPMFGVAYSASVYRSLQINQYWQDHGLPGVSTRLLALGAMVPSVLPLIWPVGLMIPASVWHRYGAQEPL
jgi:hypothetical protein